MTIDARFAWAAACAALLATPATVLASDAASIRAEGPDGTVLAERSANVPTGGTTTLVDPVDGETTVVPNNRGTSFLVRAAEAAGVSIGFRVYNFGAPSALITRIGPVSSPLDWSWSWKLKVNHRETSVGSDDVVISPGDTILWMPSVYGVPDSELDVVAPIAPRAIGEAFTIRVDRYDDNAVRTPGSAVTVTYAGQAVTTGADGTATLTSVPGWNDVVATAPHPGGIGNVRDSARACGFAPGRPEECGMDPLAVRLPDVAPNASIASSVGLVRASITVGGRAITVEVPMPVRGRAPVAISPDDIRDESLTPRERRDAAGRLASSLAADLNARAASGDTSLALPTGVSWQAAWLSGSPYVAPLRPGESLMGIRTGGPRNTAAIQRRVLGLNAHLERCAIDGTASAVRRHGYAMTTLTPARVRTELVACITGQGG